MSLPHTTPSSAEPGAPSPSLLVCGIGARLVIAAIACGLLWLAVSWALT
ncbi:MAG: hypothetical protein FWF12_03085 [Betaproteobacteria bacterium]|nr:hypothetical protein [Betaproteobacteria bacterium]